MNITSTRGKIQAEEIGDPWLEKLRCDLENPARLTFFLVWLVFFVVFVFRFVTKG